MKYIYIHPEAVDPSDLFGINYEDNEFELASIDNLNYEIEYQKDAYDYFSPWDGIFTIKEGVFKWDDNKEKYVKIE